LIYLLLILIGDLALVVVRGRRNIIIDGRSSGPGLVIIIVRHLYSVFLVCGVGVNSLVG